MNLDTPISNIMTTNVVCVEPQQKLIDLKHIYERPEFHSHIPVTENDKLVGIVSLINFMRAIHDATLDDNEEVYHNMKVSDIMTLSPVSMKSDITVREAAEVLSKGQFHSLIIADNDQIKGIVTTTDLIKLMLS